MKWLDQLGNRRERDSAHLPRTHGRRFAQNFARTAKGSSSFRLDIFKGVSAYVATGLLGAAVTYAITAYNRLPSRALTVLPAGIHITNGPTISCADMEFIMAQVNSYVDFDIRREPCNIMLSRTQSVELDENLKTAEQEFKSNRLDFFQVALQNLKTIANRHSQSDQEVKKQTLAAISDLNYISANAPPQLGGAALLKWAEDRVNTTVSEVKGELNHIDQICKSLEGIDSRETQHTDLFFVATNSSDVEFYISTSCSLSGDNVRTPLVLQRIDNDDILSSALVYVPVLPGRGKLLKYSPKSESQLSMLISSPKAVKLDCMLASGRKIATKEFLPQKFVVSEVAFAH